MIHPRQAQIVEAARKRLAQHMHSLDPTVAGSAEMSAAKADGKYADAVERLLRAAVTGYSPDIDIARALAELDPPGDDQ